jgi:hypothetical protein
MMTPTSRKQLDDRAERERLEKRVAQLRSLRLVTSDVRVRDAITAEIDAFQTKVAAIPDC